MTILLMIVTALVVLLSIAETRKKLVTRPAFKVFKKILPPLSQTEKEAMEAGSVWWDGELFGGKPDWKKLHQYPKAKLSEEEQAFMDQQVNTLLKMLDDFDIVQNQRDLPKPVWDYLKSEGFFCSDHP
jgi:hypothetical protein